MKNLILIFLTVFFVTASNSQEKKVELKNTNKFNTGIGVVDMKKMNMKNEGLDCPFEYL